MDSPSRRASRQTIISVLLLLLLLIIVTAVFFKQFFYDPALFNIESPVATDPGANQNLSTLQSLLPDGFEVFTNAEIFDAENLYIKINGKADLYLASGFKSLSCQRFAYQTDEALWMELFIYDMQNPYNALAVFGTQKRAEATNLDFTQFVYKTENAVFCAKGKYYLELIGATESKKLLNAIVSTAAKFVSQESSDDTAIVELQLFPIAGLDNRSFKLYPVGVFGFNQLNKTFTAEYNIDDLSITAFLSKRSDSQQAKELSGSYYNFLIDNGAKKITPKNKQLPGKVLEFYGSIEWVAVKDNFVLGIHEAPTLDSAETLALALFESLEKAAKNE